MATLLLTALGTVLGGPIGGALGALAGRQIDTAIMGSPTREGPRIKELAVTTASYGDVIARHFGQMRVAGSLIWATDLVEHSETTGGGKGKPKLKTYNYSSSFAVALASRRILRLGRIWADGNLLRGADGVLKAGGTMRVHTGHGDQPVDPLLAAAEGAQCPAFRGTAYVVFEDLQLADFGNRIPALTFEVFADEGTLSLARLFDGVAQDVDAEVPLDGVRGVTCEGSLDGVLAQLQPLFAMSADAGGARLTIAPERRQSAPLLIGEATASSAKDSFGARDGFRRTRAAQAENPPRVLRYYDVDRDYQPGLQRAPGRPLPGQPTALDLPAALGADDARALIAQAAKAGLWSRESLAWRTAELDPAVAPGALVRLPGQTGTWRVLDWEWRESGIELTLERAAPAASGEAPPASAGRANRAGDAPLTPTVLAAFEAPWDGTGSGDTAQVFAAASSAGAGWTGAQLLADPGDGSLVPLGTSGRARAVTGVVGGALPPAHPALIDRRSQLAVTLAAPDLVLTDAGSRQLANGANRALVGEEIVQFGRATAMGNGVWRLEQLLRGRGGTEAAIASHAAGETFVLLDGAPVALDLAPAGGAASLIAALGLADHAPVEAPIACRGIALRPLSPVRPRADWLADGGLRLRWTRRARGAWAWLDGVETPLHEQGEAYDVAYGPAGAPVARWSLATPELTLTAADLAGLRASLADGQFSVRQRGTYAVSAALDLVRLG